MPFPISGRRLAPKISTMMSRMITISGRPIGPKRARTLMGALVTKLIGNSLPPAAAVLVILALTSAAAGAGSGAGRGPGRQVPGQPGTSQEPQPQPRPQFSTRVTQVEVYATV